MGKQESDTDIYSSRILDFITKFKATHKEELEDVFSNGFCYYFAMILYFRFFKIGTIMYIPIYNHFCYKVRNNYYDINGLILDDEMIKLAEPWDTYKEADSLESFRIIRDCILKVDPDEVLDKDIDTAL